MQLHWKEVDYLGRRLQREGRIEFQQIHSWWRSTH